MIANIVQSRSKETEGEMKLCAFYELCAGRRDQIKKIGRPGY